MMSFPAASCHDICGALRRNEDPGRSRVQCGAFDLQKVVLQRISTGERLLVVEVEIFARTEEVVAAVVRVRQARVQDDAICVSVRGDEVEILGRELVHLSVQVLVELDRHGILFLVELAAVDDSGVLALRRVEVLRKTRRRRV